MREPPTPAVAAAAGGLGQVLGRLAADPARERIGVGELVELLGERALGALLVVFALLNLVPAPPGASLVLGAPLVLLSLQLHRRKPWLPRAWAARTMPRTALARLLSGPAGRWLARAERWRGGEGWPPALHLPLAMATTLLALLVMLPLPLATGPPALAMVFTGLAWMERDRRCLVIGLVLGVLSFGIAAAVLVVLGSSAAWVWGVR